MPRAMWDFLWEQDSLREGSLQLSLFHCQAVASQFDPHPCTAGLRIICFLPEVKLKDASQSSSHHQAFEKAVTTSMLTSCGDTRNSQFLGTQEDCQPADRSGLALPILPMMPPTGFLPPTKTVHYHVHAFKQGRTPELLHLYPMPLVMPMPFHYICQKHCLAV